MFRLALRGLFAHKIRLISTALAVVLAVGFIAGTYVLTDTLKAAITNVIGQSQTQVAVTVQAKTANGSGGSGGFGGAQVTLPQSAQARVAAVPGVAAAQGLLFGQVEVVHLNGTPISRSAAFELAFSVGSQPTLNPLTLRRGHFPSAATQAVIDAATAGRLHIAIGQRIRVAAAGPARTVTVVGIVGYGTAETLAGAVIVGLTLPATQSLLALPGRLYQVGASAQPGVSPTVLAARMKAALGPGFKVQTEAQAVASATASVNKGFSIFGDVLLVFAGVALFVALFLIFNTFSILLAQRSRELALLRCLGAYRRQIALSVMAESALIGLLSSIVGLGVGVLLALGLRRLLAAFGASFPPQSPVIALRTVVVSLVVGTVATMIAALLPAIRGSRTSPVAALREEPSVDVGRPTPVRWILGALLVILGVLVVVGALHGNGGRGANAATRAEEAGLGLVLAFLGIAALVPIVAKPMSWVLGWPFAVLRGVPGQLGRRNAMRHPRRTAATASALMIGLTLVTTIGVFATSVQASVDASLQTGLFADYVVTPSGVSGLAPQVATTLSHVSHLKDVAALQSANMRIELPGHGNRKVSGTGTEIAPYVRNVDIPATSGHVSDVRGSAIAVTTGVANTWHLHVGSPILLSSSQKSTQEFTVAAIIRDPTGLTGDVLFAPSGFARLFPQSTNSVQLVLAQRGPGVSPTQGLASLHKALIRYPQTQSYTKQGFINNTNRQFQQLITLVTAMLLLAVIIALFGIVNTLALSIVERKREIGLLRALGMSRRQLRAAVRWESVIVALLGTILGIGLGLLFSWVVVDALRSDGVDRFSVPVTELVVYVVLAGVAGVIAAIVPARSAAKVDILSAITTE